MAPGLIDRVDCARLAKDAAVLEREYPLSELPRLSDVLADTRGGVKARFAFTALEDGHAGASVAVRSAPQLMCRRCAQAFAFAVESDSDIEFVSGDAEALDASREIYLMDEGQVSLRELAEEELLLALPVMAACGSPQDCGRAPAAQEKSTPFAVLQDLLKKTR